MKKILIMITIILLLMGASITSATSFSKIKNFNQKIRFTDIIEISSDDVPSWAKGNISGIWGIELYSIFIGKMTVDLGAFTGYYGENILGRVSGKFTYYWNESRYTNFAGIFFGPFVFGKFGEIEIDIDEFKGTCNESNFVGLGDRNETNFHWRIMGKSGPTFYIEGLFEKFE